MYKRQVPASFNKFFNRSDMANFADYIVIMGYDEHYKGSDAGSVSSIQIHIKNKLHNFSFMWLDYKLSLIHI